MPLMKRAGAPIESLFRSTYDLFIYYHREGVWDPSSFDEENYLLPSSMSMGTFEFRNHRE